MYLTAALFLGHLIADFPLQTSWIYQFKTKSWVGVLLHSAIHVIVTACLIQPLQKTIPLLIILGVLHFVTDFTKVRIPAKRQAPGFLIDQGVHIGVVFLLAYLWQDTISATLPMLLLTPLIIYTSLLGIIVFLWVVSCDLAQSDYGKTNIVQWARANLLHLSRYAGLGFFIFLVQTWGREFQRLTSS